MAKYDDSAQDALNRLRKAEQAGKGCRLSADEVFALSLTAIGEIWAQPDPRKQETSNG